MLQFDITTGITQTRSFRHFTIIWTSPTTVHSSGAADSLCSLGNVPQPYPASNLIRKQPSSLSSSSPASSSSSFLLFTTSTHAQLLSTLVLSGCAPCVCVFVLLPAYFTYYFTFLMTFLSRNSLNRQAPIVFAPWGVFQATSGSCPGRGGDLLPRCIFLEEEN